MIKLEALYALLLLKHGWT